MISHLKQRSSSYFYERWSLFDLSCSLCCRIFRVNFLTVDGLECSYTYIISAAFLQVLQSRFCCLCCSFLCALEVCFLGVLYLVSFCSGYFLDGYDCGFLLSRYFSDRSLLSCEYVLVKACFCCGCFCFCFCFCFQSCFELCFCCICICSYFCQLFFCLSYFDFCFCGSCCYFCFCYFCFCCIFCCLCCLDVIF